MCETSNGEVVSPITEGERKKATATEIFAAIRSKSSSTPLRACVHHTLLVHHASKKNIADAPAGISMLLPEVGPKLLQHNSIIPSLADILIVLHLNGIVTTEPSFNMP